MSRATTDLLELERRMLQAVETAHEQWEESGGPIPMALVKLMKDTHSAILGRLGKRFGVETEDPMEALLILEREREALKKLIEMQQRGMVQ